MEVDGHIVEKWGNSQKIGEVNLERIKGYYQWMKGQGDVITSYFYHVTLILVNYSINYRMCYLKIRNHYHKFFSVVLLSIPILSFSLLQQLANLQLAKLCFMSLVH